MDTQPPAGGNTAAPSPIPPPTPGATVLPSVPMPPSTPMPPSAPVAITNIPPVPRRVGRGIKLAILGMAIVTILGTVAITFMFSHNALTSWEVLAANNSAAELSADVSASNSLVKTMETAGTLSDFTAASATLSDKITDATRQYDILRTSPVLKDKPSNAQFLALKPKWAAYANFLQGTSDDYRTLGPLLIQLSQSQQSALAASRQSQNLATELTQYQALIDATGRQTTALSMKTDPDRQMLTGLQTYIKSSTAAVKQTQTDFAARKGVNAISADTTAIAGAAATFSAQQDSLTSSSSSQLQQLDPSAQINSFTSALGELSKRINQ